MIFLSVIFFASKADVLVFVVSSILVFGLIFLIFLIKEIVARYSPILEALIQINFPLGLFIEENPNLSLILELISLPCKTLSKTIIITTGVKIIDKNLYIRSKKLAIYFLFIHSK